MNRKPIAVTEAVIEKAMKADSSHCMIADAIRAACPAYTNIAVDLQTIRVTDRAEKKRYIFFTPLKAQQELLRFDQGNAIEPSSFLLPRTPAQILTVQPREAQTPKVPKTVSMKKPRARAIPTVNGGAAPPPAVLSNSRGRRRVFGIRAARGFDPSPSA